MIEDRSDRGGSSTSRPKPSRRSSRSATGSCTSPSPGSSSRPNPSPRELLEAYGVEPSKALGQHFLVDRNLAAAIAADTGVEPGDHMVEIGAGLGALTIALAEREPDRVLAIEFDRALVPALRSIASAYPSIEVLAADATKIDWPSILDDRSWIACGNLPYNVGTAIVLSLVERAPMVRRVVVMVQREVADRLVATPASREGYGPTSLRVGYHADATIVRTAPASVFWPRPTVASAIVRLERRDRPAVDVDPEALWRVVDGSFAQRRKAMRASLRRLGATDADGVLARAAVDPSARPQELDLAAFARVAEALTA
jgi:16S rRNA (adenine1518-N6/adenine1519-N6)-dimethyltransferase